jgi:tRNA-guanine transglycosylase
MSNKKDNNSVLDINESGKVNPSKNEIKEKKFKITKSKNEVTIVTIDDNTINLTASKRLSERIKKTGVKNLNEKTISKIKDSNDYLNEDKEDWDLTLSEETISDYKPIPNEETKQPNLNLKNKNPFKVNKPTSSGTVDKNTKDTKNTKNKKSKNNKSAMKFKVLGTFGKARASLLTLPHGNVELPIFMPVGTKAAMKGLLSCDLQRMNCNLMLSNTYHLTLQPGDEFINKYYDTVHNYMKWNKNVLTDSGGFQMVSLDANMTVDEKGVTFKSHIEGDNREIFLTPEKSIEIQNNLGSDIIMMLDDVLRPNSSKERLKEACHRTVRWLDRCILAHKNPDKQNLFPIVQGGLDLELRKWCCDEMVKRDQPGYAIGGLAGGEEKDDFWKVVDVCCENLPKDKPRYLMGVGYPVDLVACVLLGCDMFDCVFPTRTARFGTAFTNKGFIKLKNKEMKFDFNPIEPDCDCEVCKRYTRSYFYLLTNHNARACALVSYHNVYYLLNLMKKLRKAIIDNNVESFAKDFFVNQLETLNKEEIVKFTWIFDALDKAGINTTDIKNQLSIKD